MADQSTIQRTLNAFTQQNVAQLREAVEAIHRRTSPIFSHPFDEEMLMLEVDLTGLRASKAAEGSTKGYFSGERNATGRQLVRVSAPSYGEVLFERLYPGNTTSCEVLKETLGEVERLLKSSLHKRKRTLIRLDGGFGTDANINWLISGGATTSVPRATGALGPTSWHVACRKRAGGRDWDCNGLMDTFSLLATLTSCAMALVIGRTHVADRGVSFARVVDFLYELAYVVLGFLVRATSPSGVHRLPLGRYPTQGTSVSRTLLKQGQRAEILGG